MSDRSERLTKRQQRLSERQSKREKTPPTPSLNLQLRTITPITDNQILAFNAYDDGQHLCMIGSAGTGKTLVAIYNALKDVLDKSTPYKKILIVRTAQPSKQIGFLPGTEKEKLAVYEAAYKGIFTELFGRGDAYEVCKQKGLVEFTGTSFLRGITIENTIVIVDEFQSCTYHETETVATRIGENSKLILCGDTRQDDLTSSRYNERSGIQPIIQVLRNIPDMSIITFTVDDIVRSGFVKQWLLAVEKLNLDLTSYR